MYRHTPQEAHFDQSIFRSIERHKMWSLLTKNNTLDELLSHQKHGTAQARYDLCLYQTITRTDLPNLKGIGNGQKMIAQLSKCSPLGFLLKQEHTLQTTGKRFKTCHDA